MKDIRIKLSIFVCAVFVALLLQPKSASAGPLEDEVKKLASELDFLVTLNVKKLSSSELLLVKKKIVETIDLVKFSGGSGGGNGGGGFFDRLICKTSGGKAAIFNLDKNKFIDSHYSKTLDECQKVLDFTLVGKLTCSTGADAGKHALYDLRKDTFVDPFFAKSTGDCIKTLKATHSGITCASNSDKKTARFDLFTSQFIDSHYDKTLDECLNLL